MSNLKDGINNLAACTAVSAADYQKWKEWYETLEEHERLERLLCAVNQYFTSDQSNAAESILLSAMICSARYIKDKESE